MQYKAEQNKQSKDQKGVIPYLPLSARPVDVPLSVHFKLVRLNGTMCTRDVHSCAETPQSFKYKTVEKYTHNNNKNH